MARETEPAYNLAAGWSSPVAREAHNLEVAGSNPVSATRIEKPALANQLRLAFFVGKYPFSPWRLAANVSRVTIRCQAIKHGDPMEFEFIQVSTTCDSREVLEKLASRLIEQKISACCQIEGPVTSVYRWEGKLESASEFRLLIKTTAESFPAVEKIIAELHSYQQPQITAVPVVAISEGYAAWIRDNTTHE